MAATARQRLKRVLLDIAENATTPYERLEAARQLMALLGNPNKRKADAPESASLLGLKGKGKGNGSTTRA